MQADVLWLDACIGDGPTSSEHLHHNILKGNSLWCRTVHTDTYKYRTPHIYSTLAQWQVCMDTYYYIDTTTSDAILSFCVTYALHPQARLLLSGCAPAECSSAKAYMVPPVEMCPGPVALCTCACTRTLQQGCAALVQARPLASPDIAVKPSAAHYTTMMVIS